MLEHRTTILTLVATFFLLLIGGTVNPTGSSLACPEPTLVCNGQLFPEMVGGVLYEHGHRLAGMTVGILQILLTVVLWRRRRDLRKLGVFALFLVCAQGTLGAITVAFKLPWAVSTAHLLMSQAYTALLVYLAMVTKPRPYRNTESSAHRVATLTPWITAAAALILAQIVLGGLMRHNGGALASVDFPLHEGQLWPAGPIALKLHMGHRLFGVVVGLFAMAVAGAVFRQARGWPAVRLLAAATPVLIAVQILLGSLSILHFRPVATVVAHFSIGVVLWLVWFSLSVMARRGATGAEGAVS